MPAKRRDPGDGSLYYEKSRKRWRGAFYDSNGARRYVYGKPGGTKNECLQKLKAAMAESERGELVDPQKLTVEHFLVRWITETRKLGYRANSYASKEQAIYKHIIPAFGGVQIQKLTKRHVQRWINAMSDAGLAASSIHNYYGSLHVALEDAVADQVIGKNPSTGVTLPPIESVERVALDKKQSRLLLKQLEEHRWLRPIILLALATGMRKSECLALRWSDIDLEKGVLFVRHNIAYIPKRGIVEGPPKTKASERTIALPTFALEMLQFQRETVEAKRAACSTWQDKDLVFPGRTGGFTLAVTVDKALKAALKKAQLPDISFHNLRHSAASLLLSMGVPPKVVQEILGHSSIMMTMDLYGHLFPGQQDDAMRQLHEAFAGSEQAPMKNRYEELRQFVQEFYLLIKDRLTTTELQMILPFVGEGE